MMLSLRLLDQNGRTVFSEQGEGEISCVIDREYEPGDVYELTGPEHLLIRMDRLVDESEVFVPSGTMHWKVPEGEDRLAYAPYAFEGRIHLVTVKEMPATVLASERKLARNPHDLRGHTDFYPHATANVETRNEACFAARNVIDGMTTNRGHGTWPYGSWGIGTRTDASLKIDFGRDVQMTGIGILLRADFPHDSWFQKLTLVFSNGQEKEVTLQKSAAWQYFPLSCTVSWVRVERLEKAEDPSPFPSLRGIEVTGMERKDKKDDE